jgi:2-polyprenyl-3-methyl-5-hydroxy-6-metoxy-1,4-benzoquinol methylase
MTISSDQEQAHYDSLYSRFSSVPDDDLIWNREVLLRDINNPRQAMYERRRLYLAALDFLLKENLPGKAVLDYGCGLGEWGTLMATEGANVTLLDLSTAAIRIGLRRARASGVAVRGVARDASDLSCFADGEFELVFACAALHHTLKYPAALEELCRVIRPGGKLLLVETYGNNRILNLLRRTHWITAGQPDEAGEDIIIGQRELALLSTRFARLAVYPLNLLAMGKRFFRGHFDSRAARLAVPALEAIDRAVLGVCPSLSKYCGEAIIIAESPNCLSG